MASDQPYQHPKDEKMVEESSTKTGQQQLYALPFAIQLRNTFAIEIIAKRFPVGLNSSPNSQINIDEVQIDDENLQAQVIINVQVGFTGEPRPFEISFKLLGDFIYTREYTAEMVQQFLRQGSLSILLPFAREFLLSLCMRLQVPPLILQMIQLSPSPLIETENKEAPL